MWSCDKQRSETQKVGVPFRSGISCTRPATWTRQRICAEFKSATRPEDQRARPRPERCQAGFATSVVRAPFGLSNRVTGGNCVRLPLIAGVSYAGGDRTGRSTSTARNVGIYRNNHHHLLDARRSSWSTCPLTGQCRCSSSMRAMIPRPSLANWPNSMASTSPCWCGCRVTAASMPIPHQRPVRRLGGHGGTARSSHVPTTARGGHQPASTARSMRSTAQYGYAPGPACTPRRAIIPPKAATAPNRRARHPGAGGGRALAVSDARPQAPVAVVARTRATRAGRAVAGVRASL
jgi:hypothetical protein